MDVEEACEDEGGQLHDDGPVADYVSDHDQMSYASPAPFGLQVIDASMGAS